MIKIYTFADKRPDFINYQEKLFKKFIDEKYEYIVVNAASNNFLKQEIHKICKNLNLTELSYPILNQTDPTTACSAPIQWCWNNYMSIDTENISVIIDSDMFMINKFNFEQYLSNYDICADYDKRKHVNYLWNGLMIFSPNLKNRNKLNFSQGFFEGTVTDVGGNLYYFLNNYKPKTKHINNCGYIIDKNNNMHLLPPELKEFYSNEPGKEFACEFFERTFFHYRGGSNYDKMGEEYIYKKTKLIETLVEKALNDSLTIPEDNNYRFHELDDWWSVEWPQEISIYTRYVSNKWIQKKDIF